MSTDYRAFAWSDPNPKKSIDDKVREAVQRCGFAPVYVDTSCLDCPGELAVDGVAVHGRTWIAPGHFYLVRRTP